MHAMTLLGNLDGTVKQLHVKQQKENECLAFKGNLDDTI